MSRILLVTHEGIAAALLRTAALILGQPAETEAVEVGDLEDADQAQERIADAIGRLSDGGPLLILTDLPGATPHNLALAAARQHCPTARILSGLNLPMLLRLLSGRSPTGAELLEQAEQAGRRAREAIFIGAPDGD